MLRVGLEQQTPVGERQRKTGRNWTGCVSNCPYTSDRCTRYSRASVRLRKRNALQCRMNRPGTLDSFVVRLPDSVQLRRIQEDRAVDTSEASASARSNAPPTAATHVSRRLTGHHTRTPVPCLFENACTTRPSAAQDIGRSPDGAFPVATIPDHPRDTINTGASPSRAGIERDGPFGGMRTS